jgi:nucleoid-associated protein YgaU
VDILTTRRRHEMPETAEIQDTHTVAEGDTLWSIAKDKYGDGRLWRKIFDANSEIITADAKRLVPDRYDPADPGHWIFSGQTLILPPK